MNRITSNVRRQFTGDWLAEIFVDGYRVKKARFSTEQAARVWADEQVALLAMEVR